MPVIVVGNPKGGVGKSTLSTNLAGFFAHRGHAVMLGDVDRQQSSLRWLALRPRGLPSIRSWDASDGYTLRPPRGTTHAVLDTPAGMHGVRLEQVMNVADKLLVPLLPSLFDIQSTHDFLKDVLARRRGAQVQVGVLGMRLREHTIAGDQLRSFLGALEVPVIGMLRDTQNYVHLAARGLTLWDVAPSRVERDIEQWRPILDWVQR